MFSSNTWRNTVATEGTRYFLLHVNLSANSDFRSIRYEKIINYRNHSQVISTEDIDNWYILSQDRSLKTEL